MNVFLVKKKQLFIIISIILLFFLFLFHSNGGGFLNSNQINSYAEKCEQTDLVFFCQQNVTEKNRSKWKWNVDPELDVMRLSNVLLIIQFTTARYEVASKSYALYSKVFAKIVFCGPGNDKNQFWPHFLPSDDIFNVPKTTKFVTYGDAKTHPGENVYICIELALSGDDEKNYDYDGIVFAADDVAINYWSWKSAGFTLDKSWVISGTKPYFDIDTGYFCHREIADNQKGCSKDYWLPWQWYELYQNEFRAFYDELQALSNGGDDEGKYWKEMFENLLKLTGGRRRLFRGFADLAFITRKHLPNIIPLFRLMNKHRIWMEAATATAISMVAPSDELLQLDLLHSNDYGYGIFRLKLFADIYNPKLQYLHPFKMSQVFHKDSKVNLKTLSTRPSEGNLESVNAGKYRTDDPTIDCVFCYALNMSTNYISAAAAAHDLKILN